MIWLIMMLIISVMMMLSLVLSSGWFLIYVLVSSLIIRLNVF